MNGYLASFSVDRVYAGTGSIITALPLNMRILPGCVASWNEKPRSAAGLEAKITTVFIDVCVSSWRIRPDRADRSQAAKALQGQGQAQR